MTKLTIEERVVTKPFGDIPVATIFRDTFGGSYIKMDTYTERDIGEFNAVGLGSASLYHFNDNTEVIPVTEIVVKV